MFLLLKWYVAKRAAQNRVRLRALVDDLCSMRNEEDYLSE